MIYQCRLDYWEVEDAEPVGAGSSRAAAETFCQFLDRRLAEWPEERTVVVSDEAGSETFVVLQTAIPSYHAISEGEYEARDPVEPGVDDGAEPATGSTATE